MKGNETYYGNVHDTSIELKDALNRRACQDPSIDKGQSVYLNN